MECEISDDCPNHPYPTFLACCNDYSGGTNCNNPKGLTYCEGPVYNENKTNTSKYNGICKDDNEKCSTTGGDNDAIYKCVKENLCHYSNSYDNRKYPFCGKEPHPSPKNDYANFQRCY